MPTLSANWPTAIAALGPVSVGSQAWHAGNRSYLTAIVKARFALRPDTQMVLTSRPALALRDVHDDDDPTRSVVEASDVVPHRERADVWLRGTARALGDKRVSVSMVRLAIYRSGVAMFDRTIHVIGERPNANVPPSPFREMPVVWERAYGGVGFDANPVGVGADERPRPPNLVDPEDPERPACFGPLSRYWRPRRGNVGTEDRRVVESPVPTIPAGFDWSYFQAAPRSQQLTYLHGNEWLVLDGFYADRVRIQSRLPRARGVARLMPIEPDGDIRGDAIAMVADTWAVDADQQTCTVTWRGAVELDPAKLAQVLVAGGVEIPGQDVLWEEAYRRVERPRADAGFATGSVAIDHTAAVTIVSDAPAQGAGRELQEDPLASTTVDPPRPGAAFQVPPSRPSQPIESWPSYPLGEGEELSDTRTEINDLEAEDGQDATAPQRIPLAMDTEPGAPPPIDEDDLPWIREVPVEPDQQDRSSSVPPGRARETSMPPAPLDEVAYAQALRIAGASERDVELVMKALREDRESSDSGSAEDD